MSTKVSIVIPVYNSEKTIGKCLDSLIKQTYKDIEIVCVNDCSKDNSLSILESYAEKDSRVSIINHTVNKNAGGARNSGIRAAIGDYICFVDNDDWLTPNAIEVLVSNTKNQIVDIVSPCRYDYFSDDKISVINGLPCNKSVNEQKKYGLVYGFSMLGCLIKRSLFVENDIFFPEMIFYEDNPIAVTILMSANSICAITTPLYYYYHCTTSVTGFTNSRKIADRIKTTDYMLELLNQKQLYTEEWKSYLDFMYIKLSTYTYVLLSKIPYKEAKPLFNQVKKKICGLLPNENIHYLNKRSLLFVKHPHLMFFISRFYWLIKSKK